MTIRKPRLMWLTVGDLVVDEHVQREYKDHDAQRIADAWDEEKLGTFKVSRRVNGSGVVIGDYVMDGQHRRGAMLKLRKQGEGVPCLVYSGLTLAEEAKIFLADNSENRKPTPIDIYKLSLVAEDPTAHAVQSVLEAHGLHVESGTGRDTVGAVGSLYWLYEKGGAALLDQTLQVLEDTYGRDSRGARDGQLLKGMGKVLAESTGARIDRKSLAEKLAKEGKPVQLIGTAKTHRMATGYALWVQIAHVIAMVYNRKRTSGRIEL